MPKIGFDGAQSRLPHGYQPFLVSLPDTTDNSQVRFKVLPSHAEKFRNAHTGGVEQLKHGAITKTLGCGGIGLRKESFNLLEIQILGERVGKMRSLNLAGRISF